jgi:pPIWI RE three-gene island domain Z
MPTASPDALPALMADLETSFTACSALTSKQNKYLNRGRLLLGQCLQPAVWSSLIERYAAGAAALSAYDVSRDRSWFGEKTVGFSRNRLTVLRKMLA